MSREFVEHVVMEVLRDMVGTGQYQLRGDIRAAIAGRAADRLQPLIDVVEAGRALIAAKNSNASNDAYWIPFYEAIRALRDALAKVTP